MLFKESRIKVSDNSDAKEVLCIHINKKKNKFRKSSLANFIKVTIKKRISRRKNIKKRVNWCLVGATSRKIVRPSGESLRFSKPKVIIVDDKKKKTMGSLVKGVLPREVAASNATEIVSRARRLV